MDTKKKGLFRLFIWLLEGIIVGFGAIMPGISGGTLCVAFGMYRPLMELISNPIKNFSKHALMIGVFVVGAGIGFVGLSGLAGWLMQINSSAVVCAFIGFIIGTFPELWRDAGEQGRTKSSYISMIVGFAALLLILILLKSSNIATIEANILSYAFCGVLWGLSFIVPGLSSSTMLIFFGLYGPMLEGIAHFDMGVIIPLAIGAVVCMVLLSNVVNTAFKKYFSALSHCIIGMVAATTIMIFPNWSVLGIDVLYYAICIVGGAAFSYWMSNVCAKLKK